VGVGLRKGDAELKEKFNAGIKKIREDGTYDAISKNYFASSIYGG
jgi:polar amino acid transport system substrate-binding protein